MASGLHEYEQWLTDCIDPHLRIEGDAFVLNFDPPGRIDISRCRDMAGLIAAADALRGYFDAYAASGSTFLLPVPYLMRAFCSRVAEHKKTRIQCGQWEPKGTAAMRHIQAAWGRYDWTTRTWGGRDDRDTGTGDNGPATRTDGPVSDA